MSFTLAAVAFLSLAPLAIPSDAQAYHQRVALVGHDSFQVQIVGLEDSMAAQMMGLDAVELLARIERRLQAGGVAIEEVSEGGARALLSIKIILAHNEELELVIWSAEAMVKRAIVDPENRVLSISTWSSGGYIGAANVGRARKEIEASVSSQVDRFIVDFQASRRDG